jgi:tetratricopeptide (TPR) repeat protein
MSAKPVIFISYSHKDEPEQPRGEEVAWLSFVRSYLQPAIKHGVFDLFVDEHMPGGAALKPEIEAKLKACDIFLLLISENSTSSDYIIDTEIEITRERQARGEDVFFYPLLIKPTPKVALEKFFDMKVRPRDARPLSSYPYSERLQAMAEIADEIAEIAAAIVDRKPPPPPRPEQPAFVHITGLPETPYEHLVGRETELQRLDEAWEDKTTNILSLVAEGGAGKSALVNEWLKRMQADNYRGAEMVLGWSFYSQGTKERATSADAFLNWAVEKLGVEVKSTSATTKGDAIAEELMRRRVLLVLDGVEPLQHGPDGQLGQLKDQGLRALLRRFAATSQGEAHGRIVLTSRLAIKDIDRWKDSAAPVLDLEKLSEEAGAALLRDNGVWGTDKQLKQASHDFGGHPLALGLLASFLKETQNGDVRRRDHIRALVAETGNPGQDHAARVMESYEREWLAGRPELLAIMQIVGLFDRPASEDCLRALRVEPVIAGLTEGIVTLDEDAWGRAVARLRDVRLISPRDPAAPGALDAHPLLREWFGTRLKEGNEAAWKAAHGRLYEHLCDSTKEGDRPSLEDLAPLFQAIAHGCGAGQYRDALRTYAQRLCRLGDIPSMHFYASKVLGAAGSELSVLSWFFEKPFEQPIVDLGLADKGWLLAAAAFSLRAVGRLVEALPAECEALRIQESEGYWANAAISASNRCETELFLGNVQFAIASAKQSIAYADRGWDNFYKATLRTTLAEALHMAGKLEEAEQLFSSVERRIGRAKLTKLFGFWSYRHCNLLLDQGKFVGPYRRAVESIGAIRQVYTASDAAFDALVVGRANLGSTLKTCAHQANKSKKLSLALAQLNESLIGLRMGGQIQYVPFGLLARAVFLRTVGDWIRAACDLDEVEEVAGPGPMRLFLCDLALERARLAFAQIEAFAPLNGMIEDSPRKPEVPSEEKCKELHGEAAKQIGIAAKLIEECGYHRRDAELAELQAVLKGEREFADLPVHV